MRKAAVISVAVLLAFIGRAAAGPAARDPLIRVSEYSSQNSPSSAVAGAAISVSDQSSSIRSKQAASASTTPSPAGPIVLPSLPSDSPLLKDTAPAGPGTLWYEPLPGQACIYIPSSTGVCYVVVAPAEPSLLQVSATAQQLAEQLDLNLAAIEASPAASRDGLTGATSWFWLAEAPAGQQRSISVDGETVSITAEPSPISWSFGDGSGLDAGAGVPYEPGSTPEAAVTHLYGTRCLPGDQGRDPYVLSSCQADGYHVTATTTWTISYTATGPVDRSGQVVARTTESELTYPVGEVRAFLTGGGGS